MQSPGCQVPALCSGSLPAQFLRTSEPPSWLCSGKRLGFCRSGVQQGTPSHLNIWAAGAILWPLRETHAFPPSLISPFSPLFQPLGVQPERKVHRVQSISPELLSSGVPSPPCNLHCIFLSYAQSQGCMDQHCSQHEASLWAKDIFREKKDDFGPQ